jgi:hypothetical protein
VNPLELRKIWRFLTSVPVEPRVSVLEKIGCCMQDVESGF